MSKKKKLKNYQILITGYCTVLVIGAKNESEAMEFADDAVFNGDFQHDESRVEQEVEDDDLESARHNADRVAEDPDA